MKKGIARSLDRALFDKDLLNQIIDEVISRDDLYKSRSLVRDIYFASGSLKVDIYYCKECGKLEFYNDKLLK